MPLQPGEAAPWFQSTTPTIPQFSFDTVAGRFILLVFLPADDAGKLIALKALAANRNLFDDARISAFVVGPQDPASFGAADMRGLRWIIDADRKVARLYNAVSDEGERPFWLLLDPTLRMLGAWPIDGAERVIATLAGLPAPADHAGVPLHAPVLAVPRVFEDELCRELIALHETGDSRPTGVMRDDGDRTAYVMDELKKRRDVFVRDPDLQARIRDRLERRLFPMIERAYMQTPTRIERYLISCYDVNEGGVFHAHRDNTTLATAHRRFACSINLNDDFEGGDLRFAEYGRQTYRPTRGGAVVFSCGLLHEATAMTRGRRYAFLPFFYDEAGQATLDAYNERIKAQI